MVPLARIGLATPSLPMTCSTTELQRRQRKETYTPFAKKSSIILLKMLIIFLLFLNSFNFTNYITL